MTWRQRWCGLWCGHDRVLTFVPGRVFLHCTSCQHDTPGLSPASRPPVVRYAGDARRHVVASCRLVLRKSA